MTHHAGQRPPAAAFADVSIGYDGRSVLEGLHGEIGAGELLALIGPNGGGKSTLLRALAGELRPLRGRVAIGGSGDFAYLPQRLEIDRSFPISVADFVAMGLWRRTGMLRRTGAADGARIRDALDSVGLAGLARRPIGVLSGGQMQRVLFARTLVQDAPLILLDEPFTAIDEETSRELLGLVLRWHGEGRTVVVAVHDAAQVRAHFSSAMLLAGRVIAWGHPADVLTSENVAQARGGHAHHGHEAEMIGGHDHP